MKTRATISSIIAAFTLLASTSIALAADSKIHPGSMCGAYFGTDDSGMVKGLGRLLNDTGAAKWISCPVVRDNTINTNGLSSAYIRIKRSTTATNDFWCSLDSRDTIGTGRAFASNTFTGTGYTSMSFNLTSSTSRGHYEIICRVPRDSEIISYRIDEF